MRMPRLFLGRLVGAGAGYSRNLGPWEVFDPQLGGPVIPVSLFWGFKVP